MASIVFDQVEKRYPDGFAAIAGLDLAIADGEFLVLVGPSGCGKTTALRMIAGLEEVTGGRLLIDGTVANDLAPRDRDIAMVFQSYALYPHMSVEENIGFGLSVRGLGRAEIARRVRETARLLELEDHLARRPAQLSGGQRQRVAMGRALVREPKAFLMDEPLSNLDARLRGHMRAEIARLQKMTGVTTVYVTHDQVEAMTMGDRVAVLRNGELQQLGRPRDLFDRPANLFVAGFIGAPTMNVLKAELVADAAGPAAVCGQFKLVFPAGSRPALAAATGRAVMLGIRPEALGPAADGAAGFGRLAGEVTFVEDFGATRLVHLAAEIGSSLAAVAADADDVALSAPRLRAMLDAEIPVAVGERISLAVDPARVHVFDAATGAAIRD